MRRRALLGAIPGRAKGSADSDTSESLSEITAVTVKRRAAICYLPQSTNSSTDHLQVTHRRLSMHIMFEYVLNIVMTVFNHDMLYFLFL